MKKEVLLPSDVYLGEISITLTQEPDSNDTSGEDQALRIKTEDAGGGVFFVMETRRWAFDDSQGIRKITDALGEIADTLKNLTDTLGGGLE